MAAGYPSIEFDIVVTKDNVPIVHHDPWISPELCQTTTAQPVSEDTLVFTMEWAEISSSYVCGGIHDPDFPDAQVISEPILSLEELFEITANHPEVTLNLDIKYIPEYSHSPQQMAQAIVDTIESSAPPNPLLANCNNTDFLQEFPLLSDISTSLEWPRFTEFLDGKSDITTALQHEFLNIIGGVDYVQLLQEAGADRLSVPYQLIDRRQVEIILPRIWALSDPQ